MTINQRIQTHIASLPPGQLFAPKSLLSFGSRASIDQTLSRLARRGTIVRVARGLYSRPILSRWTGRAVPVELPKVLEAIASSTRQTIAPHGAVAANFFALSTQNPLRPVYLTTGRARRVRIGHETVELRHVSPSRLPLGNSRAGLAITALRYVGRRELQPEQVRRIRDRLNPDEWRQLEGALETQPAWLIEAIQRSDGERAHA